MNKIFGGKTMFNSNNTPFTMPVMPATGGYSDGGAWGDGGWLWIIVVFALLFGWGNNGLGGFCGNNGGGYVATAATQADIQRGFDNSAVISKLDGISNGLCDGFYAMNNSMLSLAVSDWNDKTVYLSDIPKNGYLRKILAHELCHCFCFSHNISMPIEQEEYLADWISKYGTDLIYLLDDLMVNLQIGVA